MTQRQMSIRLGLDGKADIQRDLKDIEASGDATFANLGKSIDQATAAIQRQQTAFAKLTDAQRAAQSQAANQSAFNKVLGVNQPGAGSAQASAAVFQQAFAGMEARAAALRAQIDPLGAAQSKMNAAIADANTLLAAGAITEAEHAAAVRMAQTAYSDAAKSLEGFAAMEGLGSTQAMALTAAIRHMIDATIAGRPPLQALTMEAGNLSYGLSGAGGVTNAIKALGLGIGRFLISPIGLAITAFAAIGAAAFVGFTRATEVEKELEQATSFAGRAIGATTDQLEALAEQAAKTDDISTASARDIEVAFARTGTVGAQSLAGLVALTADYARKTGQGMDTARDALVKAFADPAKDGEKLLSSLGALDDKTAHLIDTFMSENEVAQAQKVLQEALTKALRDATDQTTFYGNAWQWVKDQVSAAADALGHVGTQSLTAQKAQLEAELALARQGEGLAQYDPETHSTRATYNPRSVSDILADLARVNAAIAETEAKAKAVAADAAASTLSNAAGPLVRSAIPGLQDLQNLQKAKAVMDQLAGNQLALSKLGATTSQVADAQDAYTRALNTWIDPATKAARLNQLDIEALQARTPAERAQIARQREELDLAGKVMTTAEAKARIQQAGALAEAQAAAATDRHTQSLRANLAAQLAVADAYLQGSAAGQLAELGAKKLDEQIGQTAISGAKEVAMLRDETAARKNLNDQVAAGTMTSQEAARQMEIENALAPLRIAYDRAEGEAKAELGKIIASLTNARRADNAEQDRSKALADIDAGNRNIALLQQELQIANDNDAARQIEIAVLEEKQKLLASNISIESAEGKQLLANAAASAGLNQQLDLAKESRGELESMFDSIGSQFQDFIAQGKYDWQDFAQAGIAALKDIEGEMFKLAVLNPLKNLLFGTNLPDITSVGGVLGSLFGTYHAGGMAEAANTNRMLPANVLRFAPRFHDGFNLGPDEVPAILQTGERVLNREQTREYNRRNAGGVTLMPGAIQIVTPGPAAFQASKGQVAASLARAVAQGMKRV